MDFLENIGIKIKDKDLLLTALTHSSYGNEKKVPDYERLEFLGDAILQIIISEYFYIYTDLLEGEMTKKRAAYVCERALAQYSADLGLRPFIRLGRGQKKNLGDTILADIFESTLGSIYLSNGYRDAKRLVYKVVVPYIKGNHPFTNDYKSLLQELIQTTKQSLEYITVKESGPAHNKTFVVEVRVNDIIYGKGTGKNKKEAEQMAAYSAYKKKAK